MYTTLSQYKFFLLFVCIGFVLSIIVSILGTTKIVFHHIVLTNVIDFVLNIALIFGFLIANLYLCYGEFRWYIVFAYALGCTIEKITLGKLIAKMVKIVYTYLCKVLKRLLATKFGRAIAK